MESPATSETLELASQAQKPENWVDLPDHFWIRVMKLLPWSDLNSMHLVCRRFDQVASKYVPHKLVIDRFQKVNRGNDYLVRYFEEILVKNSKIDFNEEQFQEIRVIARIGVNVKKLTVRFAKFENRTTLIEILMLLPNLKTLYLEDSWFCKSEPAVGKVKLPKLSFLVYIEDFPNDLLVEFVLNNLEGFALEELEIAACNLPKFMPFLKSHEKTLKKLNIFHFEGDGEGLLEFFGNSEDLHLEYLKLNVRLLDIKNSKFLNFLRRKGANLKTLIIGGLAISNAVINVICESLPNLKTLKLEMFWHQELLTTESTDNLWKLKNLKKISFPFLNHGFNYMSGLGLAVNENLQTLEAIDFQSIPPNFITTLPSFIPNLKTLKICRYPCELIDHLKLFENLEDLELGLACSDKEHRHKLIPINDVVAKNMKNLKVWSNFVVDPPTAAKISKDYPNLESIEIVGCYQLVDGSVGILLKNLKELKDFNMDQRDKILSKEILTHIKNYGKKLTKFTVGKVDFGSEEVREVLKDFENFNFASYLSDQYNLEFEVKF